MNTLKIVFIGQHISTILLYYGTHWFFLLSLGIASLIHLVASKQERMSAWSLGDAAEDEGGVWVPLVVWSAGGGLAGS